MNIPLLQPALIAHDENAHKSVGSQNKELYIVPNATHVDLYDNQADKIPFAKFAEFFKKNLK